ncbi:MAG: DNA helicase UvrD [Candidatus Cloacimonetes bacterium]|nr:DNA helicase UvrD [Candidatus Cloacimonadota bacterium]
MKLIADLHPHSKYARACSGQLTFENNTKWANWKGLHLIGTADFTHPFWFQDIKESLTEAGEGIYRYKNEKGKISTWPLFLLTVETSHIFTQNNRGRRIHILTFAPSIEIAEKINEEITKHGGNLMSDGRPMLGLSCKELVEIVWGVCEDCLVIPAHAWTPWFGIFGDKGGFDSLEEAFGEYAKNIYAVETGLSSDPAMNWRIKELDDRAIVSFSDAHSPWKMGREATIFKLKIKNEKLKIDEIGFSFQDIIGAIKQEPESRCQIDSTIEFYPEEGRYHYTGHRNCKVRQSPEETKKLGVICPVCHRPLTVGVMHRVEELAGRTSEELGIRNEKGLVSSGSPPNHPGYRMLVPLTEILAESFGVGVNTQTVLQPYHRLVQEFGSEFEVLLVTEIEEIKRVAGERVGEGVGRVRQGKLVIEPGYDGVFGKVKIWGEEEEVESKQESLFDV